MLTVQDTGTIILLCNPLVSVAFLKMEKSKVKGSDSILLIIICRKVAP